MAIDLAKLQAKFFSDPDWSDMEELIESYLEPFRSVLNIKSELTNDQLAAEVRGRQLMIESLDRFLADTQMIKSRKNLRNSNPFR